MSACSIREVSVPPVELMELVEPMEAAEPMEPVEPPQALSVMAAARHRAAMPIGLYFITVHSLIGIPSCIRFGFSDNCLGLPAVWFSLTTVWFSLTVCSIAKLYPEIPEKKPQNLRKTHEVFPRIRFFPRVRARFWANPTHDRRAGSGYGASKRRTEKTEDTPRV